MAEEMRRPMNLPLGGANSKHRVAITNWSLCAPRSQPNLDSTTKAFKGDFLGLCTFLKQSGYEGLEVSSWDLIRGGYIPENMGEDEMLCSIQTVLAKTGLKVIGTLLHVTDGGPSIGPSDLTGLDFNRDDFWERLRAVIEFEKRLGSEYVTFQIALPEDMMGTGGAYRNDEDYLKLCAERVYHMQEICFDCGMNFYVETHVDRISEDPEAFCKIFDLCPNYFEVNADISHYLYRNICKGPHFERIMMRVGHMHVRMARKHGDLSADVGVHFGQIGDVGDAAADWDAQGVTWQAVEVLRPALERGLSSRAVVGEAGPCLAVKDALALDVKLVPLYRLMASIPDGKGSAFAENPFRL